MSCGNLYRRTSKPTLEADILIELRKYHISQIAKEFIKQKIVPNQYLDNLIKIETLKKQKNITESLESLEIYTDEKRIEILEKLLQKECTKHTAKLINELCNSSNT
jgi:formate dehydrogenase maturation protein FdhE